MLAALVDNLAPLTVIIVTLTVATLVDRHLDDRPIGLFTWLRQRSWGYRGHRSRRVAAVTLDMARASEEIALNIYLLQVLHQYTTLSPQEQRHEAWAINRRIDNIRAVLHSHCAQVWGDHPDGDAEIASQIALSAGMDMAAAMYLLHDDDQPRLNLDEQWRHAERLLGAVYRQGTYPV